MEYTTVKGLQQFLDEDASLKEKFTYEEFMNKKSAPDNSDVTIDEAYRVYCAKRTELENI